MLFLLSLFVFIHNASAVNATTVSYSYNTYIFKTNTTGIISGTANLRYTVNITGTYLKKNGSSLGYTYGADDSNYNGIPGYAGTTNYLPSDGSTFTRVRAVYTAGNNTHVQTKVLY